MSEAETPPRPVSDQAHDDTVLPFAVEPLDVRGRVVRLGPAIDEVLTVTPIRQRSRGLSARRPP